MLPLPTRAVLPALTTIVALVTSACQPNTKRIETCATKCDEVASTVPCESQVPKDCDKQRQALRSDCSFACAAPALHGP